MSQVAKIEPQELAQVSENNAMVSMFERMASDPNVDVDKLERLMQMRERAVEREAASEFNNAMSDAQARMRTIGADANNPQTRSKYASYGKLDKALRPIYTDNGFSLSFDTGNDAPEGCVRVLCYVSHKAGHSRTYHVDMPADGKGAKGGDVMTKTHAVGAGMSYGMRYLLKMIFNVAVGEEDVDGNDPDQSVDVSDWYAAIDSAVDMTALNALASELKAAGLTGAALRNVRAAWAKRSKEVAQ